MDKNHHETINPMNRNIQYDISNVQTVRIDVDAAAHCEIYFWMKVKKTSLERNLNIVRDVGIRCFISDQDDAFHIHTGEYMIELLSNVPR